MEKQIQISIFKFTNTMKSAAHLSDQNLKMITDIHELRCKKNSDLVQILMPLKISKHLCT